MRPGQLQPNEFELAILELLANKWPELRPLIGQLHVLSREFTGVCSYTNFRSQESASELADHDLGLEEHIEMPNVPNGMGAVLFCENGMPKFLETFTYGDFWDGLFDGYTIVTSA